MIQQFFLLQFKPETNENEIESLLSQFNRLPKSEGLIEIYAGKNIHPERYQHQFTHAIVTKYQNEASMQNLIAQEEYIQLVQQLNTFLQNVLIFDLMLPENTHSQAEVVLKGRESVPTRAEIHIGSRVWGIEKKNYKSGILTEGVVADILTSKPVHPRGIKVRFEDGTIARIQSLTKPGQV